MLRPLRYSTLIVALAPWALALGSGARLLAQGTPTSSLIGIVIDSTGAVLPRVTLSLSSPTLIGGERTTSTDNTGAYGFHRLPPGSYELTAALPGFGTLRRPGITLPTGVTLRIDLQLEVAPISENITLTRDAPVVALRGAGAPTQLDNELLQNLPTGQQLSQIINLVPGVVESVAFGGTQQSNGLFVDGLGVSDPKLGQAFLTMPFNYNWIQEVQVVALGANAEHGEFSGLSANAIIHSGRNRFSGLAEYSTTRPSWVASNTSSLPVDLEKEFAATPLYLRWNGSAQLGGPLVRDRLWFFTGVQYLGAESRSAGLWGANRERTSTAIVKITAAPSAAVRLEAFYQHNWWGIDGAVIGPPGPPETLASQRFPGKSWSARLTWLLGDRTLLELRHSGYRSVFSLEPMSLMSRSGPAPHLDLLTGRASGNAPYYVRFAARPLTAGLTLTRYADGFLGRRHELKFGLEFQRAPAIDEFGFPGGRSYLDVEGHPFLVLLFDGRADRTTSRRVTLYAQDAWTLNDRLRIYPGLRFSMNRGSVPERGTVLATNPLSLRVGLAWDLTPDHRTVVRAHYGRYHDTLLSGQFQFMDSRGEQNPLITALPLLSGELVELDRFDGSKNFAIDDRITHSYVDQYVVGIERDLPAGASLQAQYIRRDFKNFIAFVDTGSIYQDVPARDPGPDGRIGTADDGGIFPVFNKTNAGHEFRLLTNPPGAFRRYNAFQVVGRKRHSRGWQVVAAYTWSRSEGNVDQQLGSNAGLHDAAFGGVFANPNRKIHAVGRTSFDFTHELKLVGTYRVPLWGGFNLGAVYRYHSGLAWGRRANILWLWQGTETVRLEPRGTRRLPAISGLDLRGEKTFRLRAGTATLGIFADVFNVTNQGSPNSRHAFAVVDVSGENFGQPGTWLDPRTFYVGLRVMF